MIGPKEISKLIDSELGGDRSLTNLHNCKLEKCLIRPKKRKLRFGREVKEYWIVLEEDPVDCEGFKVFFEAETGRFGLAMHAEPFGYVCNFHDTFTAAFKSM